ncbi:MAG: 1-deoxy-D-xylulose-5-phosphate reductoisomerase [Candidatus Limnocylindria bacterium]
MNVTRLAILGATGSIGRQALDVASAHPDRLRVTRTGHRGDDLVALAAADDVDLVLVATPGIAGLDATVAALEAGKDVALANKEVLVVGGHLVRALAGGAGKRLRPVDSEHCALWQCLAGVRTADVARVTLTASGGPFRETRLDELAGVSAERALRHPTWTMGPKVTIDSATLVNKGYEVIEAHWLYGLPYDRIDVVLHPESVVHAMVELVDGSVIAQLAEPDMRLPIQYALLWGHERGPAPRLDLLRSRELRFAGPPDPERYPCLDVVLSTARGGDARALIGVSAADEIAVERFLGGEITFGEIAGHLRRGAEIARGGPAQGDPSLEEIRVIDRAVRLALSGAPAVASA